MILRAGLTGGIACGKSTVAGFFAELGACVVDADAVTHALLAPDGAAHSSVVERFGERILDGEGRIDRRRLGEIVFGDPRARRELERILHPRVRDEASRRMDDYEAERLPGQAPLALFDAALLVETGAWRDYRRIIVVSCSRATQLARLRRRDGGLEPAEAEARLAAQTSPERRLAVADHVIDTEGTLEQTRARTVEVFEALVAEAGGG